MAYKMIIISILLQLIVQNVFAKPYNYYGNRQSSYQGNRGHQTPCSQFSNNLINSNNAHGPLVGVPYYQRVSYQQDPCFWPYNSFQYSGNLQPIVNNDYGINYYPPDCCYYDEADACECLDNDDDQNFGQWPNSTPSHAECPITIPGWTTLADGKTKVYLGSTNDFGPLSNQGFSWVQAEAKSIENSAILVEMSSKHKSNIILELLNRCYSSNTKFWIGGNDLAKTGSWVWSRGQDINNYFNWDNNQPKKDENLHCMQIQLPSNKWIAADCWSKQVTAFVAEIPLNEIDHSHNHGGSSSPKTTTTTNRPHYHSSSTTTTTTPSTTHRPSLATTPNNATPPGGVKK